MSYGSRHPHTFRNTPGAPGWLPRVERLLMFPSRGVLAGRVLIARCCPHRTHPAWLLPCIMAQMPSASHAA